MSKRLEQALALALQGFRIFPIMPGAKRPYSHEGWKAIMTTNEEQIRRWFDERPDMNYAVVCDPWHVILDPDEGFDKKGRKKEGIKHFLAAEQEASPETFFDASIYDNTFRVRTPKGGVHLYFNSEGAYANSVGTVIPDVDVRGPDGYVVGPGSYTFEDPEHNTAEGEYCVEVSADPADLPTWLKAKLEQQGRVGTRAANAGTAAMPVDTPAAVEAAKRVLRARRVAEEGQGGDQHTYVTAALCKDYGVSEERCFDLMYVEKLFDADAEHPEGRTWNDMCEPPWDYIDLQTKVHNAYKYGNRQIGSKMDALSAIGAQEQEQVAPGIENLKPGEHLSAIVQPIGEDEDAKQIAGLIGTSDDFIKRNVDVESLIPGWIPAFGVTAVLARRGTGKTVCLNDISHAVACGKDWNGVPVAADWSVIYLCGEDDLGLQRQMKAWRKKYGVVPGEDRMLVAPAVPNLMDKHQVELWAEELKKRFKGRRVMVVLDTWQRATSTASQNDDKEMQRAIHHAEALARYLNGCAVIAFHPPKGNEETITGSAVLENSTVCIMNITSGNGGRKLAVKRIKGRGEGNYFTFALEQVEVGGKELDGTPITGVIPGWNGGNSAGPSQRRMEEVALMRAAVFKSFIAPLLKRKEGRPVSMRDATQIVLAHIGDHPNTEIAKWFNNSPNEDDLMPQMKMLFNPGIILTTDDMVEVTLENDKFRMR